MRKADFQARIKRIEIANKTTADGWQQAIRVILDDIDLTNENLLELRQFKPNENVLVTIEPAQMSLFETAGAKAGHNELAADESDNDDTFLEISDGDGSVQGKIAKAWNF